MQNEVMDEVHQAEVSDELDDKIQYQLDIYITKQFMIILHL
jgi:hypothetical protein